MKQLQSFVCAMGLAVAAASPAAEPITVTNKNGVVYKNITVIRKDRDGILFRSESGGGRLKAVDMGEELQTRFGFDPATVGKIADEEKQKAVERDRSYNEAAAKAKAALTARTQENATLGPIRHSLMQGARLIRGTVSQKGSGFGILVSSGEEELRRFLETERLAGRDSKASDYPNDKAQPGAVFVGKCLLVHHPKESEIAGDDKVNIAAYMAGTYEYESVSAGTRSVRKFDCDLEGLVRAKARTLEK